MLRKWLRQLFSQDGFRGPVLTLLSGTAVGTGIAYFGEIVLMRVYSPADFGLFTLFTSFLALLLPIGSLRYEDALMVPKEDDDAAPILGVAFLVMVAITLIVFLLFYIFGPALTTFMGKDALLPWLLWVPFGFLVIRIAKLIELWLTRKNRFPWVSGAITFRSIALVSMKFTLSLPSLALGASGLIGGYVAGHLLHGFSLLVGWRKEAKHLVKRCFKREAMRTAAYRFRRFPLYGAPAALLNAVQMHLPVLALGFLFAEANVVGWFGQAMKAVLPISLLARMIAQVFFVRAAEAHHAKTLTSLTTGVHKRLVMLSLFPSLVLICVGPELFSLIGPEWKTAGTFVQYLMPWLMLAAIASPLTRLFDVLEKQHVDLYISILMFTFLCFALLVGWFNPLIKVAVISLGVAGSAGRIIHIGVMTRLVHIPIRTVLGHYAVYLLYSIPFLALLYLARSIESVWLFLLVVGSCGLGYYSFIAWKEDLLQFRNTP